jgi:hypothetical protein
MECDVCLIEWDVNVHIPRILSCGHTICEACLISMFKKSKTNELFCPSCMKKQKEIVDETDIKKLIKNICLLRIAEKIESRKTAMSQSFLTGRDLNLSFLNNKSTINCGNINSNSSRVINDWTCIYSSSELICKSHGLQAHSYAIVDSEINNNNTNITNITNINTNNTLPYLCDLCIKESSKNKTIRTLPLPNFIKETKRKMNSTEIKINLIKHEIERLEEFFRHYLEEFETTNMAKIDELFTYLNKLIFYNHTTAKTVFQQCKKEQESQIFQKLDELKRVQSDIQKYSDRLSEINSNKDDGKSYTENNENLNEIYSKVNSFLNYESELTLFQMRIGVKEGIKETMFEFIQNAYEIDVDFAKVRGEPPLIKHILQKDKIWQCPCGEFENQIGNINCVTCSSYRKIESYENILFNPMYATKEEIKELIQRRKEEIKEFQDIYKIRNDDVKIDSKFYVVDIEWFLLWKCFVTNDMTDKYISNSKKRISPNRSIGILAPGPISNSNLFEKCPDGFKIKQGLKKNDDYISVSEDLWMFFNKNYGGGPQILYKDGNICILPPSVISNYNVVSKCDKIKKNEFGLVNDNITFERKSSNNIHKDPDLDKENVNVNNNNTIEEDKYEDMVTYVEACDTNEKFETPKSKLKDDRDRNRERDKLIITNYDIDESGVFSQYDANNTSKNTSKNYKFSFKRNTT